VNLQEMIDNNFGSSNNVLHLLK